MFPVNSASGNWDFHTGMWPPETMVVAERMANNIPSVVMNEGIPKVSVMKALV